MKVISLNVNGIRSAYNKGLFSWLEQIQADIICIQELRCDVPNLPPEIINWKGYYSSFYPAQKKGYSGVAIYARKKPQNIIMGINHTASDIEGRYLQFDYPKFSVVSIYLPSGSSSPESQLKKFDFMHAYQPFLEKCLTTGGNYIICGDWNIAHQEIDLKNWKNNLKNSGFLPIERQWISDILNNGLVDGWRQLYPNEPGYTWWSNRGRAYINNVGWRIDYQMQTSPIADDLISASIFKSIKFSDHAPLIMEYKDNWW